MLRIVPALLLALMGAAVAQSEPEPFDEARYQHGLTLYLANSCGACHTLSSADTVGFFGPTHEAIGVIAGARVQDPNYGGGAVDAEGYLRESLLDPRIYLVPGFALTPHRMPAYSVLDEAELDALVYFLLQQPPPTDP
jgi:mono/diheme cytochrome c family protein